MADPTQSDLLFQVDPAQFVAERNALAKELKAAGQRDEAARVAKLRRPPTTVWALNQVARSDPGLVDAVLEAGSNLRSTMERALAGDASALRAAQMADTRAVNNLVDAGCDLMIRGGHPVSDVGRRRMAATLRAAILDPAVAGQLGAGTLEVDREAPGFGLDALSFPAAANPAAPPPADLGGTDSDEIERRRRCRARLAELVDEADRLGRRAERLAAEASEAERRASEARWQADQAAAQATAARAQAEAQGGPGTGSNVT